MKRALACVLLLLASIFATGPTPADAAPAGPTIINTTDGQMTLYKNSKVLIIGASKYRHPGDWPSLDSVPAETKKIEAAFIRQGFTTEILPDPTSENLLPAIITFLVTEKEYDARLVVYFAGHGWSDGDDTGFLVPVDAPAVSDPGFLAKILSTQLIVDTARRAKAKHVLFIFDSCFSGAVFLTRNNLAPSQLFLDDASHVTRQFITSGSANETVPARSYFAARLIDGLGGEADIIKDGVITANELGYWLKTEVSKKGEQTPQVGTAPSNSVLPGDVMFLADPTATSAVLHVKAAAPPHASAAQIATRSAGRPATAGGQAFAGYDVFYFRKTSDGKRVADALDKASVPYRATRALIPQGYPVNAIGCHADTPAELVRSLARALTEDGVPVQAIKQFENPTGKTNRLELLSITAGALHPVDPNAPALTLDQIAALQGCPRFMRNPTPTRH